MTRLIETPAGDACGAVALSVLLPCYNEEAVIDRTLDRVDDVCRRTGLDYEIVAVDDGSSDHTLAALLTARERLASLVVVKLSRNHGHQLALSAGLSLCRGELVLIMDADLQDPPELLPEMLAAMADGVDVVFAQRRTRPGDEPLKRLACAVFYRLLRAVADHPIPLDAGDFRLLSRRVVNVVLAMPERHRFLRGMVSWVGFKQQAVLYDRDRRQAGRSKYSLRKLLLLAIDGVVSSSVKPLALASLAGVVTIALGLGVVAFALYSFIFVGRTPPGWTSLVIIMTLLSGVQLAALGIMGEYLGRVHEQVRGRPLFLVDQIYPATDRGHGPPHERAKQEDEVRARAG